MADFNKIILLGRVTRDPEVRSFGSGGKVAKFGFAASPNRKKNQQSGQWESEPMFIDVEAFNRGENGTLANIVEQFCRKGAQILVEGKLHLDQWDDKATGAKRQKHKVIADTITLLDKKGDQPARASAAADAGYSEPVDPGAPSVNDDGFIPF